MDKAAIVICKDCRISLKEVAIELCPLHAAAQELLDVCRRVLLDCCAHHVNPESCAIAMHHDIRSIISQAIEKREKEPRS